MIEDDQQVLRYLPNYSKTHRPDKSFLLNIINTVHKNSIINWVKKVKKQKLEEKQKEKNDFLIITKEVLKELESFESLYEADIDKKNRLAGLLCESRKKEKKERKKKFVLEVVEKNFSSLKDDEL